MQDTAGGGVAMHWPPQLALVTHSVVWVHDEPVGQPSVLPTVGQGMAGGGVNTDAQSPPQVIVCVQIESKGHTLNPPTIQEIGVLATMVLVIELWCLVL